VTPHTWIETRPETHLSPAEHEYGGGQAWASVTDGEDEYEVNARLISDGGEPCVEAIDEVALNGIWYSARTLADGRLELRDGERVVRVLGARVVGMLEDAAVEDAGR
jgi:hypothetical protein